MKNSKCYRHSYTHQSWFHSLLGLGQCLLISWRYIWQPWLAHWNIPFRLQKSHGFSCLTEQQFPFCRPFVHGCAPHLEELTQGLLGLYHVTVHHKITESHLQKVALEIRDRVQLDYFSSWQWMFVQCWTTYIQSWSTQVYLILVTVFLPSCCVFNPNSSLDFFRFKQSSGLMTHVWVGLANSTACRTWSHRHVSTLGDKRVQPLGLLSSWQTLS